MNDVHPNIAKVSAALAEAGAAGVVRVLPEQNLVLIRGAVPGANGELVVVRKSIKTTKAQQQKAAGK